MRAFQITVCIVVLILFAVACGQETADSPTATSEPKAVPTATSAPEIPPTEVPTATVAAPTVSKDDDTPPPTVAATATQPPPPTEPPAPTTAPAAKLAPERNLDIVTLLPFDGIPAIDNPQFFSDIETANMSYNDGELVLGVEIDGDARAYSVPLLSSHEIVNDVVGGHPIAITW